METWETLVHDTGYLEEFVLAMPLLCSRPALIFSFDLSLLGVFVWECVCCSTHVGVRKDKVSGFSLSTVEAKLLVSSMLYAPSQLKLTGVSCLCSPSCFGSARITNVGTMSVFFFFLTWIPEH